MLTHADAIGIAKRGRKLLRAGKITHRQLVLIDCLLWSCRDRQGRITVSYTALCRLCRLARGTIAGALDALQALGLLSRIKRRIRTAWHQGGSASRQATSSYVLHTGPHTESSGGTVIQSTEIQILPTPREAWAAQCALAKRRRVIEARMALNKGAGG
jgi:hypothetical protein